MNLNEISELLDLKKRTVNFWVKEYDLEEFIEHSNAGNTYSETCVKLLEVVKYIKEKEWFSAKFIQIIVDKCKKILKNKNEQTFLLPEEINSLIPNIQNILFEDGFSADKESDTATADNFLLAEYYRKEEKNLEKAIYHYELAVKEDHEFKELSVMFINILNDILEG